MRRAVPGSGALSRAYIVLVAILLSALLGCAGSIPSTGDVNSNAGAPLQPLLPPFPADIPAGHSASIAQDNTIDGENFLQKSAGAMVSGTALQLPSASGAIEWGMYQYPTGGAALLSFKVDCTLQSGDAAWVGLANYARHAWEFHGPYTSGTDIALGTDYVSPAGNFFFLVVAFNGAVVLENSATVTTDVAPPTYSISGAVLQDGTTALAGVQMTLTPGGSTATTDAAGAYSFNGVAADTYTVTPALNGYSFTPMSREVPVGSADVTGVDFSATAQAVTYSISGTVLQDGTTALAGVEMTLTPGGAKATTDSSGAYVFSSLLAGSYTITPALAGYSFTPASRDETITNADLTDIGFSATLLTYSISGTVLKDGTTPLANVQLTLTPGGGTATTNASGAYTLAGVAPGSYTVTPALSGYTFTPASRSVTVTSADLTDIGFSASLLTYSISGTVLKDGTTALAGVTMTLTPGGATATTNAAGSYTLAGVAPGSYTVTPALSGYTFTPASRSVTVTNANLTSISFSASLITYTVSGTVLEDGTTGLSGVQLTLTPGGATATTNASGAYTLTGVAPGSYTATPALSGYDFTPANRSVTVTNSNVTNIDFTAAAQTTVTYTNDIKPILDNNCVACHNASIHRAGVQLQDYNHAVTNATISLAAILDNSMPPSSPLSAAQKALFQAWVDAGEPE